MLFSTAAKAPLLLPASPAESRASIGAHHEITHAALKERQMLRQESISRKLSRLAIMAALKRE
jgi:hypothetical protein